MKKKIYIFAIMLFALVSCDKEEVSIHAQSTNELTLEEQKMRSALETTTNILIDMIVRDQTYFDELNKFIVAGSPNYMEGRVMLKDLFSTTSQTDALRAKTKTNRFTTDFAISFAKNKQQKIKGSNGVALNYLSNSDALINYLIESNVSIYCPHPINEYKEDNRRPAISFHPIDNDSINVGYVVQENGEIAEVIVSQSYNDNHPVLILMPYEEEVVLKRTMPNN